MKFLLYKNEIKFMPLYAQAYFVSTGYFIILFFGDPYGGLPFLDIVKGWWSRAKLFFALGRVQGYLSPFT